MPIIIWKEEYSVGVKEFDEQHKKMFALINSLYDLMKEDKEKEERKRILQELADYAKVHLATEEKYFNEYNYPKKEEHTKIHDSYRAKIKEFLEKEGDFFLSYEVIDFLEDWWLGHILSVDKQYQEFFNAHGLK